MGMVKCSVCGEGDSIAFCAESGAPLCANCAVTCQVCYTPISRERVNLTSTGRKLCTKCMAERNARRKAQKEQLKRRAAEKKQRSDAAISPSPGVPRSSSGAATDAEAGTSFSSLTADEPLSFDALTADEAHPEGEDQFLEPEHRDEDDEGEDDEKKTSLADLSPEAQERSTRLELGPVDESRPVLTSSGYQAPSGWKYAVAFFLFGVAGALFLTVSPALRDLMWPYKTPPLQFAADRLTPVGDTNTLRDTSNVSQLDIFSQGPIFLITWSIVLVYVTGCVLIIVSLIRSGISSYLARRRLKHVQEEAEKDGYSFPG